ncbi:MAG: SMI1/KNR4 family protein [Anaerolineaceae bacterium]|nr:SMI1/KNR4 family protein [Anaerolineaceae bacterium]
MKIHILNPRPYGPLSRNRLNNFERSLNITLPNDYKDFLLKYNGGQPKPSCFWIKQNQDGSGILNFYGLHDGNKYLSISTYKGKEPYGIPDSMIPIGEDGIGNYICISISNDCYGVIYFLDHDIHPYNDHNSLKGITKIADNFTSFINSLIDIPD